METETLEALYRVDESRGRVARAEADLKLAKDLLTAARKSLKWAVEEQEKRKNRIADEIALI